MASYEIWTAPSPGENALRHEYRRWNEDLEDVIAEAKHLAADGERGVRVVEVTTEGDRSVTVLWEAEPSTERRRLTCKRCGASWEPRVSHPVRCAKCKTPLWDRDRVRTRLRVLRPVGACTTIAD